MLVRFHAPWAIVLLPSWVLKMQFLKFLAILGLQRQQLSLTGIVCALLLNHKPRTF